MTAVDQDVNVDIRTYNTNITASVSLEVNDTKNIDLISTLSNAILNFNFTLNGERATEDIAGSLVIQGQYKDGPLINIQTVNLATSDSYKVLGKYTTLIFTLNSLTNADTVIVYADQDINIVDNKQDGIGATSINVTSDDNTITQNGSSSFDPDTLTLSVDLSADASETALQLQSIELKNNITPSGNPTVGGYSVTNNALVALGAQTDTSQNGIWQVNTSGAWTLITQANDIRSGTQYNITNGYYANYTFSVQSGSFELMHTDAVTTIPTGFAYVSSTGNDHIAELNNPELSFARMQNAADEINLSGDSGRGYAIKVSPSINGNRYDNLVLDQFDTRQLIGTGDETLGRDLTLTDKDGTLAYSSFINMGFLGVNITNFNGTTASLKFTNSTINTGLTIDNDPGAEFGIYQGNTYLNCGIFTAINYLPIGYAQQTTPITETYIGCKFGDPLIMTINSPNVFINLIGCQNIPTFVYQNGATSAQVTDTSVIEWGSITGTLSNQTDLQSALNDKQNLVTSPTANHLLLTDSSGQAIDSGVSITTSSSANNNNTTPTTAAMQAAIATAIINGQSPRGGYNASSNLYPSTGGSGAGGAITANDFWYIIADGGTLGGLPVYKGNLLIALVNNPGQTSSNWILIQNVVFSVFGRTGVIIAQAGDYSFPMITGLPSTATLGKLMRGTGTAWAETTASYPGVATNLGTFLQADGTNWIASAYKLPTSAGTSGQLSQSNGTDIVYTTATYPSTATSAGTIMRADGTNWVASAPTFPNTAGSGKILRGDGTNWVETTAQYPATAGTASTLLRSDGTNFVNSTPTFPNTATSGKVMRGNGANWVESTPTFPNSGTSGKLIRGDGTNYVETTAQYSDTAGTSGNVLTSDGTNFVSSAPALKSYGVFVPFLANKVISGSDWGTVTVGADTLQLSCPGGSSPTQFVYNYFLYLKAGITYRFCFTGVKFNSAGIAQFVIKSDDQSTTYNTLSNIDLYSSTNGPLSINKQTFAFSPAGFNNGDWVPCTLVFFCNSKNASSSNYFILVPDGNAGFSFYEKYS